MGTRPGEIGAHRSPTASDAEEYREVSLVDIARVMYRRRLLLALALAASLAGGAAFAVFTTPEYEARATLIPLEEAEIIENWLGSRQAAEYAVGAVGERLYPSLYPTSYDSTTGWKGAPPTSTQLALALKGHVIVDPGTRDTALIGLRVVLPDPIVAQSVAAAYLDSLDVLRPQLENITRAELFDKYYDGTNAQEAQRRAETTAREKSYWLLFDEPVVPSSPVRPQPVLYMFIAVAIGVVGGVALVFAIEWLSKYRGEFARVEPPPR